MPSNLTPTTWYAASYSEYNHTHRITPVQVIKHTDTHVWLLDPDNPKHWLRRRRSLPTISYFPLESDALTFIINHLNNTIVQNLNKIDAIRSINKMLVDSVLALEARLAERSTQ